MNILSTLFSFKGQISRKTYWLSTISLLLFFVIALQLAWVSASDPHKAIEILSPFVVLLVAISFFSLQVKRCHDIGWTGWLALLSFVPVVHWIWWFLLGIVTDKSIEKAKNLGAEFGKATTEYLEKREDEIRAKEAIRKHRIINSTDAKEPTKGNEMSKLKSDYDKYKALTENRDWAGICSLNGVDLQSSRFATMKEMNRLPEQLQPGEVVICFTAGVMSNTGDSNRSDFGISTWLVALTDRRFLFLDAAMLTSSIDVHSILHKNVQAVRVAQGLVLGKINIDTGGRSTLIDNCEKKTVKVLGDLANEWLQILDERRSVPEKPPAAPEESGLDKLKKLAELKALGLVSEQEFNDVKTKILASL